VILRKYRLKGGSLYWHRIYYDLVPNWMCKYGPPGGDYNYAAYLYQPHKYFMALYNNVKYFIQRGRRGWSDRDAWGWNSHHSEVMVGVIKYLLEHKHGYPVGLTPGKWDKALKVMEDGFQAAVDDDNDFTSYKTLSPQAYKKLIYSRRRKLMLGLKYFREYYFSLWD
jgi:hypothetical protein